MGDNVVKLQKCLLNKGARPFQGIRSTILEDTIGLEDPGSC